MAKRKQQKVVRLLAELILILLVAKCANQLPPGGGEIDKIPPEIIDIYPANGTINFDDDYFEISFTEYVDKRSVQDAIFISPALEHELDFDWSGKSLEINFQDILRKNTTYILTIGTDVVDHNNRNNMAESFTLVFSTGNYIDKGIVSGKVYDKKPQGVLIFAFKEDSTDKNPLEVKPDYISQVGESGYYKLMGLAKGKYKIFAILDDYRDFIYNVEQDKYGAPFDEIIISDSDTMFAGYNFFMTREDTTLPEVQSAVMTDRNHILLDFSEYIDSSQISIDNFSIYDSTLSEHYNVSHFFKGRTKEKQMVLTVKDSLSIDNEVFLIADTIIDLNGKVQNRQATKITVSDKPDTLAPQMIKAVTEYGGNKVDYENAYAQFSYDDGLDAREIINAVELFDKDSVGLPVDIDFIDDATFKVTSSIQLEPKSKYKFIFDLNSFEDIAGNKQDTTYTYNFDTINELDFTGISGQVKNAEGPGEIFIIAENIDQKNKKYSQTTDENYGYDFNRVVPGKYLIWSFIDADSNQEYTHGSVFPFAASERFVYYPDTLNIKARWPVGDVILDYKSAPKKEKRLNLFDRKNKNNSKR